MGKSQGNVVYRNLANAASILGVLPMGMLFLEGGYRYLVPFIIFNNVMDDLDGVLAGKLNIRSRFGANLDNVCDTVVHVTLVLMVAAHFKGAVLIVGMIAATAIIVRLTSRLDPDAVKGNGSPTNELMRHMLFVLLLADAFNLDASHWLIVLFILHSVTMVAPFKLSFLIRGLANSAVAVAFVNVALLVSWIAPILTPFIAVAFFATYLCSLALGGGQWLRERKSKVC